MRKVAICIDFDGCVTEGDWFPEVAPIIPEAIKTINLWYNQGHTIIFSSCRTGITQQAAEVALDLHGVRYHYFNKNDPSRTKKYQNDSRKIGADFYIDDKQIGGMPGWNEAYNYVLERVVDRSIILCVVGESGSGKTFLATHLERYGFKQIESYTTRAKRAPYETGHTFVKDEEFDEFDKEDMIAFTEFGGSRYCCLMQDVGKLNSYVIDEDGLRYLKANFADVFAIYSLRLYRDKNIRMDCVGKERVERDEGKFTGEGIEYDFAYDNIDDSQESLFRYVYTVALEKILNGE